MRRQRVGSLGQFPSSITLAKWAGQGLTSVRGAWPQQTHPQLSIKGVFPPGRSA